MFLLFQLSRVLITPALLRMTDDVIEHFFKLSKGNSFITMMLQHFSQYFSEISVLNLFNQSSNFL